MGWRSSSKSLHVYQSTQLLTMMIITFTNMVKEVVVMVVGERQFFKFASYISVHSNFDNDDDVSVWLVLAN